METAKIEKLVPGGQGLATLSSGKKAFIWNALPGEIVEFEITKNKSSYCEAIATKILNPSQHRIIPKDSCYLATSPWQIADYTFELDQKTTLVAECFHQNHIEISVRPIITDHHDYFYRNKMEYSLYWDNETEKIFPAFHVRGTHRKIPITQSSIERPEIFARATQIIDELNANRASARTYQSLLVRCDQKGTTSAALFENHRPHPKMLELTDILLEKTYTYSPNGFFQINLPVYEMVLAEIKNHIKTAKVLDLYAGVGTIGLSVAGNRDLTLVEVNDSAYQELRKNSVLSPEDPMEKGPCKTPVSSRMLARRPVKTGAHAKSDSQNVKPVLAQAEEVLDFITLNSTVILDPPRAGCDPKLIAKLCETKPPTIIYLSCNPITQARDLVPLIKDYKISLIQPYNFFPRTPHIENLTILTRI